MTGEKAGPLHLLFFENLGRCRGLNHFVSTRLGGVSGPPYESLNLGLRLGDNRERVLENRKRLASGLGVSPGDFVMPGQVHSGDVKVVSRDILISGKKEGFADTDALVTGLRGICIMILVADCVPILFFDPEKRIVGAAHAGWRGTLKSVARNTVLCMKNVFGCSPRDILAGIGPSIGPCCYEVGPEVISQAEKAFPAAKGYVVKKSGDGTGYFDLWNANISQLLEAGVPMENIELAGECTCHNSKKFFSHRCQGGRTGRFGAGVSLA